MGAGHISIQRILGMAGVAGAIALGACENKAKRTSDLPEPLSAPAAKHAATRVESGHDDLSKAAEDLQSAFDDVNSKRSGSAPETAPAPGYTPPLPGALDKPAGRAIDRVGSWAQENRKPGKSAAGLTANQPISISDPVTPNTKSADSRSRKGDSADRSPMQKRQDAIAELAAQLKPGIDGAKEPLRAAMPLLGLDAISSGAVAGHLELVSRAVTADQRRSVETARDLMRSFASDPNLASGDPAAMARLLREKADQLAGAASQEYLALGTVALCQRVDGFGRYATLGTNTFVAGRPAAMILYSEIENFSQSRATDAASRESAEQWRVELGQTIRLYLDSDDSEQLVLPESVVRDGATSKRRDFFLVQRVDLPKNLSVGNYHLKVAVRDIASGALAERTIPIRMVADASAIRESTQSGSPPSGTPGGPGQYVGTGK